MVGTIQEAWGRSPLLSALEVENEELEDGDEVEMDVGKPPTSPHSHSGSLSQHSTWVNGKAERPAIAKGGAVIHVWATAKLRQRMDVCLGRTFKGFGAHTDGFCWHKQCLFS